MPLPEKAAVFGVFKDTNPFIHMQKDPKITADQHRQSYPNSCATSLAEFMLKLEGECPPNLQQYEPGAASTGLTYLKDRTYGRIIFRQSPRNESLGAMVEREIVAGRAVGVFIENRYWHPLMTGVHAWAAVEIHYGAEGKFVRLLAKQSERGNGEGSVSLDHLIPLGELDLAPVTDAVTYESVSAPQPDDPAKCI